MIPNGLFGLGFVIFPEAKKGSAAGASAGSKRLI